MTLPKDKIEKIIGLYELCYGLPREAQRILSEEDKEIIPSYGAIAKYWADSNLPQQNRSEVLEALVQEAHKTTKGDLPLMKKYLETKTNTVIAGKKVLRLYIGENTAQDYSKKLGLKLKKNKDHARNLTGRKNAIPQTCGFKVPKGHNANYRFAGPAEVY
jgi:hypothetical protein